MFKYLVALVIVLAGIVAFAYLHQSGRAYPTVDVTAIFLQKLDIAIDGTQLARVEVWAMPTGTDVTEDQYQHLGDATLASASPGATQHWL